MAVDGLGWRSGIRVAPLVEIPHPQDGARWPTYTAHRRSLVLPQPATRVTRPRLGVLVALVLQQVPPVIPEPVVVLLARSVLVQLVVLLTGFEERRVGPVASVGLWVSIRRRSSRGQCLEPTRCPACGLEQVLAVAVHEELQPPASEPIGILAGRLRVPPRDCRKAARQSRIRCRCAVVEEDRDEEDCLRFVRCHPLATFPRPRERLIARPPEAGMPPADLVEFLRSPLPKPKVQRIACLVPLLPPLLDLFEGETPLEQRCTPSKARVVLPRLQSPTGKEVGVVWA